jgi:hypothetical protein
MYSEARKSDIDLRISVGGKTGGYIRKTFGEGDFSDVVYVTANAQFNDTRMEELIGNSNPFHTRFDLYKNQWHPEKKTVEPKKVAEKAKTAKTLFPDKKLIVHFIQPHHPFAGSELVENYGLVDTDSVFDRCSAGEIDDTILRKAYKQNLDWVLPEAIELAKDLDGISAITSDHGNLVGEGGVYGHWSNYDAVGLRKVPWEIFD